MENMFFLDILRYFWFEKSKHVFVYGFETNTFL